MKLHYNEISLSFVLALVIANIIGIGFLLSGCNRQMFDTNWKYNKAYVTGLKNNGEVTKLDIKSWRDYEGEQLQIIDTDDNVYLCSSFNTILTYEK